MPRGEGVLPSLIQNVSISGFSRATIVELALVSLSVLICYDGLSLRPPVELSWCKARWLPFLLPSKSQAPGVAPSPRRRMWSGQVFFQSSSWGLP